MGLSASDWNELREKIQGWLFQMVPEEVSSKDPQYRILTGLDQKALEANWRTGGFMTGCNGFAGKMAEGMGVPRKSILTKGPLNVSLAEKEVPGCWQEANSEDACTSNITPNPGDIYSSPYESKGYFQKWGHVGIVYGYEEDTGNWWVVQAGMGGPKSGADFIRWKYAKFERTKLNGWVNMAKYLMPNGPRGRAYTEYQRG